MPTFFAVTSIADFPLLRREIGYTRGVRELDRLRDEIAAIFPATRPRSNRSTIEFLIEEESAGAAFDRLADLCARISGTIPVRRRVIQRRLVAGAVRCPGGQVTEQLVARADDALLAAAAADPAVNIVELDAEEEADHLLTVELRRAIRSNGFHLVYQPKLRAAGGGVVGAEALARWTHPRRGPISPAVFIPAAERSGDIRAFTDWVIDRVVEDARIVAEAGLQCPLHVNISATLVADAAFVQHALERVGPVADRIGFEITETAMMVDPIGALANLRQLADAGIALSIDDYGTAFSSLSYLQQLPVGEIKIDQSFISRLTSGSRDPLLVRSTIDLAHAMEMKVTAEGVDAPAALALLQVMRCDMVQGFLLSLPLPLDEMIAFTQRAASGSAMPTGVGHDRWAKLALRAA